MHIKWIKIIVCGLLAVTWGGYTIWLGNCLTNQDEYNKYTGLTVLNIGDSIAENREESVSYAVQLSKVTGCTLVTDYAEGGATVSRTDDQGERGSVLEQVERATQNGREEEYDIILVDGGTNDYGIQRNVGFVKGNCHAYSMDDYTGDFDETSYLGALEKVFYELRRTYTDSIIVFVIPHKSERSGNKWEKYVIGCKNACEKWSIPIVDIYSEGNLNGRIIEMRHKYTDEGGTHPNTLGVKKFYLPKLIDVLDGCLMSKHMREIIDEMD